MLNILRGGLVAILALALISQTGCDPNEFDRTSLGVPEKQGADFSGPVAPSQHGGNDRVVDPRIEAQPPQIIVGSFNIQMFGKSKMAKQGVMNILTDIARRFDVLAIQELRDKDQNVIPQFLELINSDGSNYAAAVGPRQGYSTPGQTTRYFEQSVFIYDTTKVELVVPSYAAYDRYQIMHRSPFVGHFQCTGVPGPNPFSFVLMNVHIDPDDTQVEFEALREIIGEIYTNHRGEDDFILLGDMNESPERYQSYQWMQSQYAAIPSGMNTNTAQTKAYDNIIFDSGYTAEFKNQAGVMNLQEVYGLSLEEAQLVSDHFPVWAVFSSLESPRTEMTQGISAEVIR